MVSGSTLTLQDTYLSSSANIWNTATTASLILQVREDNILIHNLSQSIFPTSPTTGIAQNVDINGNKVYDIYGSIKNLVVPTTTTTTSTTTTTTTANPSGSLFFDASSGVGGYSVTAIDVNGVTPTLTSGTNVPFSTDGHGFATNQTGTNETLNITIGGFTLDGCVSVTDSNLNNYTQDISGNGTKTFTGLVINNVTTVQVALTDNLC
jgi:hypothetical protein